MRTLLLAACFLPMSSTAQANHRSLEDVCAVAAGMIVDKQHTNSVISVHVGARPRVVLELHAASTGASFPVTCRFTGPGPPYHLARVCVITTCYSLAAAYATRRALFGEIQDKAKLAGH